MAPPIDTITALLALRLALRLLIFSITLCNLSCPTCDSGALAASIITRDASLIVPVGESLSRARNQTFHFALLIVWSTEFEITIFASEAKILLIAFSAADRASLYLAL